MAEKDTKKAGGDPGADPDAQPGISTPEAQAPAIVRGVVERVLAPRHCVVDAATGAHKFAGQTVNVTADFADAHPECFV